MEPTLSVIVPNYNHGLFLERSLGALLDQQDPPDEIVLIDDGSTDDSIEIIESLMRGEARIRLFRNDRNRGVNYTVNRGFQLATGRYVCPASADDALEPRFLGTMRDAIARWPDAGFYLCDFSFFDPTTGRKFPKHLGLEGDSAFLSPERLVERLSAAGYILPTYGGVYRRQALAEAGYFLADLEWHADWFANLVIGFRHGCAYLAEAHASITLGAGRYSSGSDDWQQQRAVLQSLYRHLCSDDYADVLESFLRSGALGYFGWDAVRALRGSEEAAKLRSRMPLRAIAEREAKNLLLRMGSTKLRQWFWSARWRLQGRD